MAFSNYHTDFDGANDHIVIGDVAPFKFDVGDTFSVSAWVRIAPTFAQRAIVSKLDASSPNTGWELVMLSDGTLLFQLIDDLTVPQRLAIGPSVSVDMNQWVHVVVTKDGTELAAGLKMYINGYEQSDIPIDEDTFVSNGGTSFDTTTPLQIGARDGTTTLWNGDIDDVAIYNKELTPAEVFLLYNSGEPIDLRNNGPSAHLIGYWTMGDGDTYPTLKDRQVANPTTVSEGVIDRSVSGNNGTPTNMEDGDFRAVILASEVMPDLSSSGNAGTPTNMEDADFKAVSPGFPQWSWYSAKFDGANEYINIGNVAELDFTKADEFSVSFWFNTTLSSAGTIVGKYQNAATPLGWQVFVGASGNVFFIAGYNTGERMYVQTDLAGLNDGSWHHVVCTYDGSSDANNMNVVVDGVNQSLTVINNTMASNDFNNTHDATIGDESNNASPFDGYIDDVAVYNKELSLAEAQEIYNDHNIGISMLATDPMRDLSVNSNDGTPTNMEDTDFTMDVPGVMTWSRYSMTLDGTNEYVTMGNASALSFDRTDAFSLSVWFKSTDTSAALIGKHDNVAPNRGYELFLFTSGEILFQLENNSTGNRIRIDTTSTGWNDDKWHHVVATWDGDVAGGAAGANIYIDGLLQGKSIVEDTLTGTLVNTIPFMLGARNGASSFMSGQLDDAAVYDKELSLTEVQEIYNSGTPKDNRTLSSYANLVGYWGCGDRVEGVPIDNRTLTTDGYLVGYWGLGDVGPGGAMRQVIGLDGVNEYINLGNITALNFERTSTFSISAWFKGVLSAQGFILAKQGNTNPEGWGLAIKADGGVRFVMRHTATTNTIDVESVSTGWDDGNWHHIVLTFDGATSPSSASAVAIYIDGASQTPNILTDNLTTNIANSFDATIGARIYTGSQAPFNGHLSEISVYDDVVLSSDQVTELYNSGRPVDATLSTYSDLVGYWNGEAVNAGTMTNMVSGDLVNEIHTIGAQTSLDLSEIDLEPFPAEGVGFNPNDLPSTPIGGEGFGTGGGGPTVTTSYLMRAIDSGYGGPGVYYHYWLTTCAPDTDASETTAPFGGPLTDIVVAGTYTS